MFGRKQTTYDSPLSEFMRNGKARDKKRAFKKIIDESIQEQQKTIERANRILAERARQEQAENLLAS